MRTLSNDLRERIVLAYDNEEGNRQEIADRFKVSLGMVKKLLQQRRRTGSLAPRHQYSGRKPLILPLHRAKLRGFVSKQPDLTLKELRKALKLECTIQAIHYALEAMGLTYKKRHSAPANKTGPTSPKSA